MQMPTRVKRQTVDLSGYPNLVVIYLGMRVKSMRGLGRLFKLGPQIQQSGAAHPDGLLNHENLLFGLLPPHAGMRQYWRDFDRSNGGHAAYRTKRGGRNSCAIAVAPDSGTKRISRTEAWKRFTTTYPANWASAPSRRWRLLAARCFRPPAG